MTFHRPSGQPGVVDIDRPEVIELMADVAAAAARRGAAVPEDIYELILWEIPQLRGDKPVPALLASSVDSNVGTCLQIMQHRIDLAVVRAPAAAVEYARRLAPVRGASRTGCSPNWPSRRATPARSPPPRWACPGLWPGTGELAAEPERRAGGPDLRPAVR